MNQVSTFHCVTGWTVQNVHWGGVRIADVLAQARPVPAADALEFVSAESPYTDYLTMQQAALHDVMLAYEMDGKPLPREHGAPLRLVIPDMYGYKNVKWLNADQRRSRLQRTATGRRWATTVTRGSAAPTATRPAGGYVRRFSRTERAAALGERARLLRAARLRADPLPAEPRGASSAGGR